VTCPCALSLATPTAITAATSSLARRGLLITRAETIETLAHTDRVVLDKTGTLTLGEPLVSGLTPLGSLEAGRCLQIAAGLERTSTHPIARAFRHVADPLPPPIDAGGEPGQGLEGSYDGIRYRLGRRDFVAAIAGTGDRADAGTYLGRDGEWLAEIAITDSLRPGAREAVARLARQGIATEIASGDHATAVAAIAGQAGIADYHARLRPEDKMALVRAREAAGETVLMVGDGINDAPVLAAASVSIAMGAGASLAQTSAGAVLMTADLDVIPSAVETARKTVGIIRQNLGWAVVYNVLALPLAALGYIPPWAAAIGMSTSSLLVVANALRLRSGAAAPRPFPAMTPRATGSPA
jgi:Cu2+-exporting ATPase